MLGIDHIGANGIGFRSEWNGGNAGEGTMSGCRAYPSEVTNTGGQAASGTRRVAPEEWHPDSGTRTVAPEARPTGTGY